MQPQNIAAVDITSLVKAHPEFNQDVLRLVGVSESDGWRIGLVPMVREEGGQKMTQLLLLDPQGSTESLRRLDIPVSTFPPAIWQLLQRALPGFEQNTRAPNWEDQNFSIPGVILLNPPNVVAVGTIEDMQELKKLVSGYGSESAQALAVSPSGLPLEIRETLSSISPRHWQWSSALQYLEAFTDEIIITRQISEFQRDGSKAFLGSKVLVDSLNDTRYGRGNKIILLSAMESFGEEFRLRGLAEISAMLIHAVAQREILNDAHSGTVDQALLESFSFRNSYASARMSEGLQELEGMLEAQPGAGADLTFVRKWLDLHGRFRDVPSLRVLAQANH